MTTKDLEDLGESFIFTQCSSHTDSSGVQGRGNKRVADLSGEIEIERTLVEYQANAMLPLEDHFRRPIENTPENRAMPYGYLIMLILA